MHNRIQVLIFFIGRELRALNAQMCVNLYYLLNGISENNTSKFVQMGMLYADDVSAKYIEKS
jgi:hypothetical protein